MKAANLIGATINQLRNLATAREDLETFRQWRKSLEEAGKEQLGLSVDFQWGAATTNRELVRRQLLASARLNVSRLVNDAETMLLGAVAKAESAILHGEAGKDE